MDTISPVEKLNLHSGNLAKTWKEFRQQFEIYLVATEAINKPEPVKVAILLNAVGPETVKLYNSFNLTEMEKGNLARVLMEFEKHFTTSRRNQLYDTYLFEKRRQEAYETFDIFVEDVKRLVKYCGYQNEDRMVRDRIVFGILDRQIQKRLFAEDQLSLEQAIEMGRAAEGRLKSVSSLHLSNSMGSATFRTQTRVQQLCVNCNFVHPWNVRCAAYGKVCKYCNKQNHYSGACRKKRLDEAILLEELQAQYGTMQI